MDATIHNMTDQDVILTALYTAQDMLTNATRYVQGIGGYDKNMGCASLNALVAANVLRDILPLMSVDIEGGVIVNLDDLDDEPCDCGCHMPGVGKMDPDCCKGCNRVVGSSNG